MTIPDCQKVLPPAHGGKEIIPESMLWLLLTGQVPSEAQVRAFSKELAEQGTLDDMTIKLIDGCILSRVDWKIHPRADIEFYVIGSSHPCIQ